MGLPVRRACYGVVRFIMENGAQGCEVIVSGKVRAQRAKGMKFTDGYMIRTGDACRHYLDTCVRNLLMRQGVLGIKVTIMKKWDPDGSQGGPRMPLPDKVTVLIPKEPTARPAARATPAAPYDANQ